MLVQAEPPPWVGLEERVCSSAPYDTAPILGSHGSLAAIIAGFGLAGFILLVDRGHEHVDPERGRGHTNGSLLFALAAIVGLTSAYLFSSLTGDHCLNTQIQFDYPSVLLAIAALLLVSGISVVATSHPQLGDTATALRVVLAVTAFLVCARVAVDYEYADQINRSYERLVDRVDDLSAESPLRADRNIRPGSMATIDRQLGLYASDRWPDRSDEWPGLLATELFDTQPPATMKQALAIVGLIGIGLGVVVARMMTPVEARGFDDRRATSGDDGPSTPPSKPPDELAASRAEEAEATWRRWVSRVTVAGAVIVVGMFNLTSGSGDELTRHPMWQRGALFGVITTAVALLIQPPLAGFQRSVPDALVGTFQKILDHGRTLYGRVVRRFTRSGLAEETDEH